MRRVFSRLTALACCALLCAHVFAAEQRQKVLIQLDKKITPAQVRALQQNYGIKPAAVYDKLGVQIWQLQENVDSEVFARNLLRNPLVLAASPVSTSRVDIIQTRDGGAVPDALRSRISSVRPPGTIASVNAVLPFSVTRDILVNKLLPEDKRRLPVKFDLSLGYRVEAAYGRTQAVSLADGKTALLWSTTVQVSTRLRDGGPLQQAPGKATFVFSDDQTWGRIDSVQGTRLISPGPGGYTISVALDASALPPDHAPMTVKGGTADAALTLSEAGLQDCRTSLVAMPGVEITLGIVFTSGALDAIRAAYTATVIEKVCPVMLTLLGDMNDGFQLSNVPVRFRLVGVARAANYAEPKLADGRRSVTGVLQQVLDKTAGVGKAIHTWRGKVTADIVLFLAATEDACGAADENIEKWSDETRAVAVADARCAIAIRTGAHEIGHVMGLRHDRDADSAVSPFTYGHGFVHIKSPQFMTIMGSRLTCPRCSRTNLWSNPSVISSTYGVPMGDVTTAHEARVIQEVAPTIAKFR